MLVIKASPLLVLALWGCAAVVSPTPPASGTPDDPSGGGKFDEAGSDSTVLIDLEVHRGRVGLFASDENRELLSQNDTALAIARAQLRFSMNALEAQQVSVDFGSVELGRVTLEVDGQTTWLEYDAFLTASAPAAVFDAASQNFPAWSATVPRDPTGVFTRFGDICSEGGDGELTDDNYFYYFAPHRPECDLVTEVLGFIAFPSGSGS